MTLKLKLQILIVVIFIIITCLAIAIVYTILRAEKKAKTALNQKKDDLVE